LARNYSALQQSSRADNAPVTEREFASWKRHKCSNSRGFVVRFRRTDRHGFRPPGGTLRPHFVSDNAPGDLLTSGDIACPWQRQAAALLAATAFEGVFAVKGESG